MCLSRMEYFINSTGGGDMGGNGLRPKLLSNFNAQYSESDCDALLAGRPARDKLMAMSWS